MRCSFSFKPYQSLIAIFCALFLLLGGCESHISTHGNMVDLNDLDSLKIGTSQRAEVQRLLGTASFGGAFDDSRLYYNSQKVEKVIAGHSQTIERQLIILSFDKNNTLQSIEIKDKDSDLEIVKLDDTTPTPGDNLTIIDQIFSNLRRR